MQKLLVTLALGGSLALFGCDAEAPSDGGPVADSGPATTDSGPATDSGPEEDAGPVRTGPTLWVVNVDDDLTSFVGIDGLQGDLTPSTRLARGRTTMLERPRTVTVTGTGRLIVGREGGGIVVWDDATMADGEAVAEHVVDGDATRLEGVRATAYDAPNDRLYVGASDGAVLVFDDVSAATFEGDLAPSRAFGPPDRAPYDALVTETIRIGALVFADGVLYVADASSSDTNHSRILAFDAPATADGMTTPSRIIESSLQWDRFDSMDVHEGRLLATDGRDLVFVFDSIATAEGAVTATIVTIGGVSTDLTAVEIGSDGVVYLADRGGRGVSIVEGGIDGSASTITPDRSIGGAQTRIRTPLDLFVVE